MPSMHVSAPNEDLRPGWRARLAGHRLLRQPLALLAARREQILYLVVGGWNTVFGYMEWAVLQFLLGNYLHYLVIVVISWPIAVINAYLGYRYLIFHVLHLSIYVVNGLFTCALVVASCRPRPQALHLR